MNATALTAAASGDSSSTALIIGSAGLALAGAIAAAMGYKWARGSSEVVPTNADGTINKGALVNELVAQAEAKSPVLAKMGAFVKTVKTNTAKVQNFVNSLPLPESVKSIVNDPTKLLSKKRQDEIHAIESVLGMEATAPAVAEPIESAPPISVDDLKKHMDALQVYMNDHVAKK
jgi:hypothetical protein